MQFEIVIKIGSSLGPSYNHRVFSFGITDKKTVKKSTETFLYFFVTFLIISNVHLPKTTVFYLS